MDTLCVMISGLDKCHISAFVACKDKLKRTLNRRRVQRHKRGTDMKNLFEIVKKLRVH